MLVLLIIPIIKPILLKLQKLQSQMLYFACIFFTSLNYFFIRLGSLQRACQRLQTYKRRVFSFGSLLTKRQAQCLLTGDALQISQSRFAISRIQLIQGENPYESRSITYQISSSSLALVNRWPGLHLLACSWALLMQWASVW